MGVSAREGRGLQARDQGTRSGGGRRVLGLGGRTRNAEDFELVAERLSAGRRVVGPDYRGRGRSDRDANWRHYAPVFLLADLQALLIALGLGRVAVIGTSLGGLLGMGLAVLRPTGLAGIVLNDVGPELNLEGLERIRGFVRSEERRVGKECVSACVSGCGRY